MRKVRFSSNWQIDYPNEGVFISWGIDADDGSSYTVALMEMSDGTVETVIPTKIKFQTPDTSHHQMD